MNQTKTLGRVIGYINNITEYFTIKNISERREKRWKEKEAFNREWKLHNKKYEYIDSLQLVIGNMIREMYKGNNKAVIYNSDKGEGYYVAIGDKTIDSKTRTESVNPNIIITLNANSIDDMVLTVTGNSPEDLLLGIKIKNDDDYKHAKVELCKYIRTREGSRILQDIHK